MTSLRLLLGLAFSFLCFATLEAQTKEPSQKHKIVLVAGDTAKVDVMGHHDYIAGCKCLEALLTQTPGIETVQVQDGWPKDEHVFDGASAVVFYTDGAGKQAFLSSQQRIDKVQAMVDAGVGIVMIHQQSTFPMMSLNAPRTGSEESTRTANRLAVTGIAST